MKKKKLGWKNTKCGIEWHKYNMVYVLHNFWLTYLPELFGWCQISLAKLALKITHSKIEQFWTDLT